MAPNDYCYWGRLQDFVYHRGVTNLEELKQAVNDFNETLSENDVRKMVGSILRRAQLCIDSDGDSFEHLLKKKKKSIQETGDSRSNGSIDSSSSSEDSEEEDEESEDESEEESEITSSIEIAGQFSDTPDVSLNAPSDDFGFENQIPLVTTGKKSHGNGNAASAGSSTGVRKKAKTKEVKDTNGKVKSSSKFLQNFPDTDDDNDFMVDDNDSFGKRLGIDSSSSDLFKPKKKNFFDDLSSDEEYQNMTEKERNEKLAPKISQLDGNCDSSDDDEITSSKK